MGNGQDTNVWHDSWCDGGPLDKLITRRQVYNAGFLNDDTVYKLSTNGNLQFPTDWYDQYPILYEASKSILDPEKHDEMKWLHKKKSLVKFSISKAWKDLGVQGEVVPWCKVVWFSNLIPKHAFILWLLMNERLSTQDRLLKWYPSMSMSCPLCNNGHDSHDHLFFKCNYSSKVWQKMRRNSKIQCVVNCWKDVLNELVALANVKNIWIIIKKASFCCKCLLSVARKKWEIISK